MKQKERNKLRAIIQAEWFGLSNNYRSKLSVYACQVGRTGSSLYHDLRMMGELEKQGIRPPPIPETNYDDEVAYITEGQNGMWIDEMESKK